MIFCHGLMFSNFGVEASKRFVLQYYYYRVEQRSHYFYILDIQ
jgi:hypothetical protein